MERITPKVQGILFRAGDAFLPAGIIKALNRYVVGGPQTLVYLNVWSFIHFASGAACGAALWRAGIRGGGSAWTAIMLLIHTVWENMQIISGMTSLGLRGLIDIVVDTLMFMAGGWLAVAAISV
jgi:hypothetical protein